MGIDWGVFFHAVVTVALFGYLLWLTWEDD